LFIETVATENLAMIKFAKLALQKTQSPKIRKYAQMIIDDREKAAKELKEISSGNSAATPQTLDLMQTRQYDWLSAMSGWEFDRDFKRIMTNNQDRTIEVFKKAKLELSDPQLKAYVEKNLPTMKQASLK